MERRRVRLCAVDLTPPVMVENLPADVCEQCGERVYDNDVLAALAKIRDGLAPGPDLSYLYVYDYDEVAGESRRSVFGSSEPDDSLVVSGRSDIGVPPVRTLG